ncbi:MAG: hypothetical protein AB1442_13585 [Nitrospirota bacterium]
MAREVDVTKKITDEEARDSHRIWTDHEQMDNGELRFRLKSSDGNDYIRTVAGKSGAWQKAHKHMALCETYVVISGWIGFAERKRGQMTISVLGEGDVVTTRPGVVHNVYLPAGAVIHTAKHGGAAQGDWHEDAEFTQQTSVLTEADIRRLAAAAAPPDERFDSYMALYNNLDNLIWRIPGFLVAGAAILMGFAGAILSRDPTPVVPPALAGGLFLFLGLLFFLSAYSMARIREHHTMAGDELRRMEPSGYFHSRQRTVARRWPPSATLVFRVTYLLLAAIFWVLAVVAFARYDLLVKLVQWGTGGN